MIWKLTAIVFLAATSLCAADFWQQKKYTQWTDKEVRQVLNNSPWARPVSIRISGSNLPSAAGRGRRGPGTAGITDASMTGLGSSDSGGSGEMEKSVMAVVCWRTALPVKQATARLRFGNEVEASPDAARLLNREESNYVITITGLPPTALRAKPDAIKSGTFLKVKGKDPIPVTDVRAERDQNRINLYLIFPRTPIELSDQEVEVEMKAGIIDIHRKFKLKEMVVDGKLQM